MSVDALLSTVDNMSADRRTRRPTPDGLPNHPVPTPPGLKTTGPLASAAWLVERRLLPAAARWSVEIQLLSAEPAARLLIEIYAEEWGFVFEHAERMSWIRVTDLRFAHGRDDYGLLHHTGSLRAFGVLVRDLEDRYSLAFDRDSAQITTTLQDAEAIIRDWVVAL